MVGSRALRLAVAERHERAFALGLVLLFFVVYSLLAILRHQSFHSTAYDLAVYDQIFWNTVNGRPLESTLDRGLCGPVSFFGGHFAPILLAIVPLYALVPRPETLLVVQTAALAGGVWPIYLLARHRLAPGFERLAWVAAYFLVVPLAHIALFDFHALPLAILSLGLALYFLERGRTAFFLASLVVGFLVKEEIPLIGMAFGAYVLLAKRRWRLGLGVVALSLAWFVVAVRVVIPAFGDGGYHYTDFYAGLGDSEVEIVRTLLTDPARVANVLLVDLRMKMRYVAAMFGPGLGLSLLSGWAVLLNAPTLAYTLLSNYSHQYSLQAHYPAPLIPLALGTAVLGMARLRGRLRRAAPFGVIASSLLFAHLYGELPFSRPFDAGQFAREARYEPFMREVRAIPVTASVTAQDFVATHVAQRRRIHYLGYQGHCDPGEYVILDYADPQFVKKDRAKHRAEIERFKRRGYQEVAAGDGLMLMRDERVGIRARDRARPDREALGPRAPTDARRRTAVQLSR